MVHQPDVRADGGAPDGRSLDVLEDGVAGARKLLGDLPDLMADVLG